MGCKALTEEDRFREWIKSKLPSDCHFQRIENVTSSGVPDTVLCWRGVTVWVELKCLEKDVLLRKEQYAWGVRHQKCGGNVIVLNLIPSSDILEVYDFRYLWVTPYANKYVRIVNTPPILRCARNYRPIVEVIFFPFTTERA
jgi:hypothetical protein